MKRILVAVDEDPQAEKVIELAGKLAQRLEAFVTVCHIMPFEVYRQIEEEQMREHVAHPLSISQAEEQARAIAADAAQGLRPFGVRYETRGAVGRPAEEIVALAREIDADFIVLGFEGLHGLERLRALGSVSRAVLESTVRPVVVVPAVLE